MGEAGQRGGQGRGRGLGGGQVKWRRVESEWREVGEEAWVHSQMAQFAVTRE